MSQLKSPAVVLGIIAIVIACSGSAVAGSIITGKQIKNSSITGADIKNESLSGDDLKGASIGPSELSDGVNNDISAAKARTLVPGPAGAQGPAGPAGPSGISNVVTVTSPVQNVAPGGYTTSMRANCPVGMSVVGTGFNTGIGNADFVLSYGSFVGGFIDNDVSITIQAYVQAVCASNTTVGAVAASVRRRAVDLERFTRDEANARKGATVR